MSKLFSSIKTGMIISASICILIGIFLLVFPGVTSVVMSYCLAFCMILFGCIGIIGYFCNKNREYLYQSNLALGILLLALGALIAIRVDIFLMAISYMFGLFIILNGVIAIQNSIDLKHLNYMAWWGVLILAILTILLGTILLFSPFKALFTTILFIAISLIYHGISSLVSVYLINKTDKKSKTNK